MYYKSKYYLICTIAVALAGILLFFPGLNTARADNPSSAYEQFYGTVANDDQLVSCGYIVSAMIGATKVTETATDASGRYGYNPVFLVTASLGATIQFSLNDHPTLQRAVFQGGTVTQLNLTAYGASSKLPQTSCSSCGGGSCGINPKTLPDATAGIYYSAALQASGGVMPYVWSISSGSLPDGLNIDSSLGVISGTPATAQTYSFTVRVDDSASNYLTESEYIRVNGSGSSSQTGSSTTVSSQTQETTVAVQGPSYNFLSNAGSLPLNGGILTVSKELSSSDGRVSLELPANDAINLQGQTVIGAGNESNPPAATDGSVTIKAYSFTPPGATFSPPATMTLRYDTPLPSAVDEATLYIAYWNGSSWIKLTSSVNTQTKEVSADVPHFTIFAIRGMPPAAVATPAPEESASPTPTVENTAPSSPAAFAYSDLVISPQTGTVGQPVTVSVRGI